MLKKKEKKEEEEMAMIGQRLVYSGCRLRAFFNSVKCGGWNCSFYAWTGNCEEIDADNCTDR